MRYVWTMVLLVGSTSIAQAELKPDKSAYSTRAAMHITGAAFSTPASSNTILFSGERDAVGGDWVSDDGKALSVTVPDDAADGLVVVKSSSGVELGTFTVRIDQKPGINDWQPKKKLDHGASLFVFGSGFSAQPDGNEVQFTGAKGVRSDSTDRNGRWLVVTVPKDAATGPVTVLGKDGRIGMVTNIDINALPTWIVWSGMLLALIFRTFVPFLTEKATDANKNAKITFDRRFLLPPILALVTGIPIAIGLLPNITLTGNPIADFVAAFSIVYASQDIIREGQKVVTGK